MGRHSRATDSLVRLADLPWLPIGAVAGVAAVVITFATINGSPGGESRTASISETCPDDAVVVAADPSVADLVKDLADISDCTYEVQQTASKDMLERKGDDLPDLWIPDSTAWLSAWDQRNGHGKGQNAGSLAYSPVLWATPKGTDALGDVGSEHAWGELLAQSPNPRAVDPNSSGVGKLTAVAIRSSLRGSPLTVTKSGRAWRQAVANPSSNLAESLDEVSSEEISLPVPEYLVAEHFAEKDDDINVYVPVEQSALLDFPVIRFNSDFSAAASGLIGATDTDKGKELIDAAYLRRDEAAGAPQALGFDVAASSFISRVRPNGTDIKDAEQSLRSINGVTDLLVVVDRSGSMAERAGDSSRAQMAARAVAEILRAERDDTRTGYWEFSSQLNGRDDALPMLPMAKLGATREGQPHRDHIIATSSGLPERLGGSTGLYDTAVMALESLDDVDDQRLRRVVILTDGFNDDPTGGRSLDDAIAQVTTLARDKGARLTLVGLGNDIDKRALELLAGSGRGSFVEASNVGDLPTILASTMMQVP